MFDMVLVTLQVSELCRRTAFTLVVKIPNLDFVDIDVEFHTGLRILTKVQNSSIESNFARSRLKQADGTEL